MNLIKKKKTWGTEEPKEGICFLLKMSQYFAPMPAYFVLADLYLKQREIFHTAEFSITWLDQSLEILLKKITALPFNCSVTLIK